MARNDPTIYMRIPQELKDALDKASEENRRSLTAEVVARLQTSFAPRSGGNAGFGLFASGSGGSPQVSEMTRAATHINELQGQRNTAAIVMAAAKGSGNEDQARLYQRQMEALDLQIASLVQVIQSLAASDGVENKKPA